jgi:hypothetical protein
MALVLELPAEIESEIDRVDPEEFDRDSAMRWQGHAVSLLGPSLFGNENSGQVATRISEAWLTSLESCSFVLHRYRRQPVISDGDLERIRSLIAELRAAVEDELAPGDELRDFLLHHADVMARALDHYQIVGTSELQGALDQTLGAVQRRGGEFESKGYTRRDAWKRFAKLAAGVLVVLQVPQTAMELPSEIRGAIEGPPAPAPEKIVINNNETIVVPAQEETSPVPDHSSEPVNGVRRPGPADIPTPR